MKHRAIAIAVLSGASAYAVAKLGSPALSRSAERGWLKPAVAGSSPASTSSPPVAVSAAPSASEREEPWTGVIVAQAVDLVARIDNAKVSGINVRVGEAVREGDILGELDTKTYQHEIAAAEAALSESQAQAWSASVSVAQARDRERRRAKLFKVGSSNVPLVSQEEIADSRFDTQSASSRASAASASINERRARLQYLNQVVADATLRAPFDGVISTRYVSVGSSIRQGAPILRVVGRGPLRVRFAVPETDASSVALQTRVSIECDGRALHGTVDRITPEVESASSSIIMEAVIEDAPANAQRRAQNAEEQPSLSALAGRVVGVRRAPPRGG